MEGPGYGTASGSSRTGFALATTLSGERSEKPVAETLTRGEHRQIAPICTPSRLTRTLFTTRLSGERATQQSEVRFSQVGCVVVSTAVTYHEGWRPEGQCFGIGRRSGMRIVLTGGRLSSNYGVPVAPAGCKTEHIGQVDNTRATSHDSTFTI